MSVELVHWPEEQGRLDALRQARKPRLLLVDQAAAPPLVVDDGEDWIRLPADHRDVQARIETLSRRSTDGSSRLSIEDGVVRTAIGKTTVPALEERLLDALAARLGRVTDRATLMAAGWPDSAPRRNLLDVHLHRLRQRLEPVGLEIRTVRKRGYVLELGQGDDT